MAQPRRFLKNGRLSQVTSQSFAPWAMARASAAPVLAASTLEKVTHSGARALGVHPTPGWARSVILMPRAHGIDRLRDIEIPYRT